MFTTEEIRAAHSKVKSGADFPAYVQEMKSLGVLYYEHFVTDGHIVYFGEDQFSLSAGAKWKPAKVAITGDTKKLQQALLIHQQGKTDYPLFCKQAAEAGVEKWIVDMREMTCTYYDKPGNKILVEAIPVS